MKGLLRKDFYMTLKYCRSYVLLIAVFTAVSFTPGSNLYFTLYPGIFCGVIPLTLLSYDDKSGWNEYCGTLPLTARQIVSAKYIIGLLWSLVLLVVLGAVNALRMSLSGAFDTSELLALLGVMFAVSQVIPALCLPFLYRFGVIRGRIVYMAAITLVCIGCLMLTQYCGENMTALASGSAVPAAVCGLGVALYALSWHLSVVFYSKRRG